MSSMEACELGDDWVCRKNLDLHQTQTVGHFHGRIQSHRSLMKLQYLVCTCIQHCTPYSEHPEPGHLLHIVLQSETSKSLRHHSPRATDSKQHLPQQSEPGTQCHQRLCPEDKGDNNCTIPTPE